MARPSPTLELANTVAAARARGEQAWSLSTPSFPDVQTLPAPDASWTKLTPATGSPELRAMTRNHFFGNWPSSDHICVITAGAKAGLFAALRSALAPGASVLLPTPAWPSYVDICFAAGVTPIPVPTAADLDFALRVDMLENVMSVHNPRALILANPCNPTGRIMPPSELDHIAALCRDNNMLLMLDQSFSNIIFDMDAWRTSVTSLSNNILLFDSFSKNHLLQGARVGAGMIPAVLADAFVTLHQTILSAAPTPGQKMALASLKSNESLPSLSRQRDIARAFIDEMQWRVYPQQGTFYFFPHVADIENFVSFARSQNVHVLTGQAFGVGYENHFRLCFGKSEEELRQILDRLRAYK